MTRSSRKRRDSDKVDVNEIEKDHLREAEVYQEQYGKSIEQRFQFVILFHWFLFSCQTDVPEVDNLPFGKCGKLFCRLGCVCRSLLKSKVSRKHCSVPECMLQCVCGYQQAHSSGSQSVVNDSDGQSDVNLAASSEPDMAVVTLVLTETPIVASGLPSEANAAKYQMAEDGVQNETTEDATSSSTMES